MPREYVPLFTGIGVFRCTLALRSGIGTAHFGVRYLWCSAHWSSVRGASCNEMIPGICEHSLLVNARCSVCWDAVAELRALASVSYRSVAVRPWFGIVRHLVIDRFLGGSHCSSVRSASCGTVITVHPWFGIVRHLVIDRFRGGIPTVPWMFGFPWHTITVPWNSAHSTVVTSSFPLRAQLLQKQILPRLTVGLFGFSSARAERLSGFLSFSSSCVASVREFSPRHVSPASGGIGVIFWQALAFEHDRGPVRNFLLFR